MRLGILADIHGEVDQLERALKRLKAEAIDQVVVLGDMIFDFTHLEETVRLLTENRAVGVWGNHDLGLCVEPDDAMMQKLSPAARDFYATMKPRLEIEQYLFSHTVPHEDPFDPVSYYVAKLPWQPQGLDESFTAFPHQVMLVGHYHRWFAASSAGQLDWNGESELRFQPDERYFVIVHAVMNGATAILDTEGHKLIPIQF